MQGALICSFLLLSCGANGNQKGARDESFCTCAFMFSALPVCSKEKWQWDSFFVWCSFVASIEKGSNHLGIATLYKFKGLPKEKKVLLLCTIQQMPGKVGHSHSKPWDTSGQIWPLFKIYLKLLQLSEDEARQLLMDQKKKKKHFWRAL